MEKLTCRTCGKRKSTIEFTPQWTSKTGYLKDCKICVNLKAKKQADKFGERRLAAGDAAAASGVHKVCSRCGRLKPVAQFSRNRYSLNGRQMYCKQCVKVVNALYKDRNVQDKFLNSIGSI